MVLSRANAKRLKGERVCVCVRACVCVCVRVCACVLNRIGGGMMNERVTREEKREKKHNKWIAWQASKHKQKKKGTVSNQQSKIAFGYQRNFDFPF